MLNLYFIIVQILWVTFPCNPDFLCWVWGKGEPSLYDQTHQSYVGTFWYKRGREIPAYTTDAAVLKFPCTDRKMFSSPWGKFPTILEFFQPFSYSHGRNFPTMPEIFRSIFRSTVCDCTSSVGWRHDARPLHHSNVDFIAVSIFRSWQWKMKMKRRKIL
jgi:hypothetical protein